MPTPCGVVSSTGSAWLSHPAGVYLGEASFALYMIAVPWRLFFGGVAQRLLGVPDDGRWPFLPWLFLVLGAVPVAMIAHNGVERPARILLRRLGALRPVRPREEVKTTQLAPSPPRNSPAGCDERPRRPA